MHGLPLPPRALSMQQQMEAQQQAMMMNPTAPTGAKGPPAPPQAPPMASGQGVM